MDWFCLICSIDFFFQTTCMCVFVCVFDILSNPSFSQLIVLFLKSVLDFGVIDVSSRVIKNPSKYLSVYSYSFRLSPLLFNLDYHFQAQNHFSLPFLFLCLYFWRIVPSILFLVAIFYSLLAAILPPVTAALAGFSWTPSGSPWLELPPFLYTLTG